MFGFAIDRVGLNVYFVLVACSVTLIGHCLIGFIHALNPYLGVVLMGLGYSMLAGSLWPIIALVVPQHRQGTAYGVVQAVQNLGLAVVQLLVTWIKENHGWTAVEVFNVGCLAASILGTVALLWSSKTHHMGYLHMTTKTRNHFETTPAYFDMMQKASGTRVDPIIAGGVENQNFVDDDTE